MNDFGLSATGLVSPSKSTHCGSSLATGSCKNGLPMAHLECAAHSAGVGTESCQKVGLHLCSRCKLLKYCSKGCQTSHWREHKSDCKSPYLQSGWTTKWAREGRVPDFATNDAGLSAPGFGHACHYVWGNLPANDCINAASNEGSTATTRDFNLAFAASGDLRNMITTVNSLPDDYAGNCRILLNDIDVTVAGRNTAILFILLSDSSLELEEAAELCLHLQYSAALTCKQAAYTSERLTSLFSGLSIREGYPICEKEVPVRGGNTLHVSLTNVAFVVKMISSTYPLSTALRRMHEIVLAPSRVDFLDRYLFSLRGPHRVSELHMRNTGILLPFGSSTAHFTEPNRLLFDGSGGWLSPDSASQLSGWDARQVVKSGKKYGCTEEDVYGCLYFHIRDQFVEFAKRVRRFKIDIHVTNMNAIALPNCIKQKQGSLRCFTPASFDRVETSNVMDYVGIQVLVQAWGPMLNKENVHSTLMLSSMNWALREENAVVMSLLAGGNLQGKRMMFERCASYLGLDMRTVLAQRRNDSDPAFLNVLQSLDAFHDKDKVFRTFLQKVGIRQIATEHGLVMKKTNTICPESIAYPLGTQPKTIPPYSKDDWYLLCCLGRVRGTERFLELRLG